MSGEWLSGFCAGALVAACIYNIIAIWVDGWRNR